jgi:hypothetical protein
VAGIQENKNINPQLLLMLPQLASTPLRQYSFHEGGVVTPMMQGFQPSGMMTLTPAPAPPALSSVMTEMQNTIQQLQGTVAMLVASSEAAEVVVQSNAHTAAEEAARKLKIMVCHHHCHC